MKFSPWNIARNLLAVLGVVFIVMQIGQWRESSRQKSLDTSSAQFIVEAVPAIFGTWNMEALKTRTDPILFSYTSEDAVSKLFNRYSTLGKLQESEGCTGHAMKIALNNKDEMGAHYACKLKFEKDSANVSIDLLQNRDSKEWRIIGFNLVSNYIALQ